MPKLRVIGHTLWYEGAPHFVDEYGRVLRNLSSKVGRALCSCGWVSDTAYTNADRKRQHRVHKEAMVKQ